MNTTKQSSKAEQWRQAEVNRYNFERAQIDADKPMKTQQTNLVSDNKTPAVEANRTGFEIGDCVRPSGYVINKARDYWLNCDREPMKSGAKKQLDYVTDKRGEVISISPENRNIQKNAQSVIIKWNDSTMSDSLPYLIQKA